MIGYSTINNIIRAVMDTGLISRFYHSVSMVDNVKGGTQPMALVKDEWQYVGPDDSEGFSAYIRDLGTIDASKVEKLASCGKAYQVRAPYRVVFFHEGEERNFDNLRGKLISFIFLQGVTLSRVLLNKRRILAEEAPAHNFKFIESTFYFAVDITINVIISEDTCESEIKCIDEDNPICK